MSRPAIRSAKHERRWVSIPGLLADIVRQRWEEFRYPGFSPFALELICFDLRTRAPHLLTLPFAQGPAHLGAALDRELYRQYREGPERQGIIVQTARGEILPPARPAPVGDFATFGAHVRFSPTLAECIEIRWREAGYASFSDYVTAVIRYDLMLLGLHRYFNGDDTDPEILASLDRETAEEFHARRPKRTYVERLLEEIAGRKLTPEERIAALHQLAAALRTRVLAADAREG